MAVLRNPDSFRCSPFNISDFREKFNGFPNRQTLAARVHKSGADAARSLCLDLRGSGKADITQGG
jgi:hypothetical protein